MVSALLIFIGVFFVLMLIPCLGVSILGYKMITKIGLYPSKTPAVQMGVVWKLIAIEVVSFILLLLFFVVLDSPVMR